MSEFKIHEFGLKMKDIMTGFTGVVSGRVSYLTGCDRYELKPQVKEDGTLPKTRWFDVDALIYIDAGVSEDLKDQRFNTSDELEDTYVELGAKVIDTVTGFKGIATSKIIYTWGDIQFSISPKVKKKAVKVEDATWIDSHRIKVLKQNVIMPKIKVLGQRGGGPTDENPSCH